MGGNAFEAFTGALFLDFAQQLVNLSRSQAYLRIGYIGFEQAWMKRLEENNPDMKVFDTSQGVDLIRGEGHWHGDHFHEGGVEPHIWNSTRNATLISGIPVISQQPWPCGGR